MRWFLILATLLWPALATGEEVVADLSQSRVQITTNFDGSEILIFGAIKRDGPVPEGPPIEVIVTVEGPEAPLTIRRKDKRFGIWINTEAAEIDAAPSFYAVATSAPWVDVLRDTEDLRHHVSIRRAIRAVGLGSDNVDGFIDALLRIRAGQGAYYNDFGGVEIAEDTLFRTSIRLPANLTEGDYVTRFLLTRDGRVLDVRESVINVRKVGLERFLFSLSREQPLVYGLMSLAIAIFAGWAASAFFRWIRF